MSDRLDCVVVGAGVVGLAIARAIAADGREVVVLEAESRIGMHSSSRNSEVIHAGLYYPKDSLKATLCVQGRESLYAYCVDHQVPYKRIHKLIVAASKDDLTRLGDIKLGAAANGVLDLRRMTGEEVKALEPNVDCAGALFSPSTGIIDSSAYMLALQGDVEAAGGVIVLNSRVADIRVTGDGFEFKVGDDVFACETLVNAAGLGAVELMKSRPHGGLPQFGLPGDSAQQYLAKGHYFSYEGKSPFNHLVYPLPSDSGLGIHATNDLGGAARFGPDVTWVDVVDYDFDEGRKSDFVAAIRRYFPDLDEKKLVPAYTGIRPRISGPGEPAADFVIQGERDHGVRGLVNLFGIESPGLTSSLAIGAYVSAILD